VQASCLHPPFSSGPLRSPRREGSPRCSAAVRAPLGNYDEGFDPYNNAIVYFFAFLGCRFVVVVAIVATLIGFAVTAAAISQV
jgi:hypothetical protein